MNYRPLRVGNLIREELGKLIIRECEFPGALVTVTDVGVSEKLEGATVRVSVVPSEKSAEALRTLNAKKGEFQYLLLKKMNIRPMPRIAFEIDRGAEHAAQVEKLLIEGNNK